MKILAADTGGDRVRAPVAACGTLTSEQYSDPLLEHDIARDS